MTQNTSTDYMDASVKFSGSYDHGTVEFNILSNKLKKVMHGKRTYTCDHKKGHRLVAIMRDKGYKVRCTYA